MSLVIEHNHRVLHLTLNRPDKRNALDRDLCARLVEAITSVQSHAGTGAVLISATGQVFSAGMDLDEAVQPGSQELAQVHEELFTLGAHSMKPIIISVNGSALGGGLGLVAQGHVVLAAESAVFGLTEIRVGLWPFLVYRSVEAALGPRRMLELSLTGRVFPAAKALDWGLVHHLCHTSELADRAAAIARDIANASPAATKAGMNYVRDARGKSWTEAGELATKLRQELMDHGDFREGVAAFKEKRQPHWPSMHAHKK